jgi:hypothetical protein
MQNTLNLSATETNQMDLMSVIYGFMLVVGTGQFVVNDATELTSQVFEVDVETMGMRENKRYILLVNQGRIDQHVQVPLTSQECKQPH